MSVFSIIFTFIIYWISFCVQGPNWNENYTECRVDILIVSSRSIKSIRCLFAVYVKRYFFWNDSVLNKQKRVRWKFLSFTRIKMEKHFNIIISIYGLKLSLKLLNWYNNENEKSITSNELWVIVRLLTHTENGIQFDLNLRAFNLKKNGGRFSFIATHVSKWPINWLVNSLCVLYGHGLTI